MEGLNVKKVGEYYYLFVAEGGTAGPPTCLLYTSPIPFETLSKSKGKITNGYGLAQE